MAMSNIFVYGTLKKGRSNHDMFLGNAKFIGEGQTEQKVWQLLDLGAYPAMTYGNIKVSGEVYEVTAHELSRIDRLEGLDVGLYERHKIVIDVGNDKYHCEAYLMLTVTDVAQYLKSPEVGDW